MDTSVVTTKGQMVVPAKIRRKLKIKRGTRVVIIEQDDGFVVKPLDRKYFEHFAGILPTKGKATKALLEERRKEREREDARAR
jgi:AbrB family looped-hinge helix DNA binding protein